MNGVFRQPGRWTVGVKFGCHVIPMGERDTKLRPLGEVGLGFTAHGWRALVFRVLDVASDAWRRGTSGVTWCTFRWLIGYLYKLHKESAYNRTCVESAYCV